MPQTSFKKVLENTISIIVQLPFCPSRKMLAIVDSKTTCKQCSRVLEELERIDDDADAEQIKMVKIDDVQLARKYGVYALPAFLFFRKDEP